MKYKKRQIRKRTLRKATPKRKSISKTKKHAKHVNQTNKRISYTQGKDQLLSIRYNVVGNEFVFALTNKNGKLGSVFHIEGNAFMNTLGAPLMVLST